ncbi:hypothetical protein NKY66_00090 [Sinorhizobium meliloti]|uniref:hypothetical protein n=1 Tax=Rhizobium meliloti TaxID=382 RepID=UPI000FDA6BC3|nr:hypothetical protein [Sinorhizobium meliloti]MDW9417109.1 hypothetical protein [Sinorhizobium meliloti]MDW9480454.1 hypothetical protein [Sinorhizobium meliloti]MDW9513932.1 hypothetical protein [Sinorhizobium meliloti]MQW10081.1 hypothetical protein [Sinorhizobium meliloti]RVG74258.1 hypothetical protein CN220_05690 [Sinorhizobium meliloti]
MTGEEMFEDLRIPMPVLDRENANVEAKWETFYHSRSAAAWQAYVAAHRRVCIVASSMYLDYEVLKPVLRVKATSQMRAA